MESTVTGGACAPAVAAGLYEHDTSAAHSAPVPSAAAALNATRTSETMRPRRKTPLAPYNEQLTLSRSRYVATSNRWRYERACRGDQGGRVTAAIREETSLR
jgi:hypothetical protein